MPTPLSSSHAMAAAEQSAFMNISTVSTTEPSVSIVSDWRSGTLSDHTSSGPVVTAHIGNRSSVLFVRSPVWNGNAIGRIVSVSKQLSVVYAAYRHALSAG